MYGLTWFTHRGDNDTSKTFVYPQWHDFVVELKRMAEVPCPSKDKAILLSPALYQPGTTRANDNVRVWAGWACVDIDHGVEGLTVDQIKETMAQHLGDVYCLCYSTASNTIDKPKFRAVFKLDKPVNRDDIGDLWYAISKLLNGLCDEQTKDLARMFYAPHKYETAQDNWLFEIGDKPLPVKDLIKQYPYTPDNPTSLIDALPDHIKSAMVEHRMGGLHNDHYTWTSYHDCPFWPKSAAAKYITITDTGWYAQMYKIMLAIAGKAFEKGYPITSDQIVTLCKQFDADTGGWYQKRSFHKEANNAINYMLINYKQRDSDYVNNY